ncbi:hypothetical protein ECANGB1_138 [Enterospora canceri]|uniref:Uncharacterized protein n=1 Tax=Enterospora canceri TaxID=1081671 RepID=A0A1Y1S943_9MICR|nr:hypothetical protein ECANGB1_138 [Enterospora canceri]
MFGMITLYMALRTAVMIVPTDDTIKQATQAPIASPLYNDVNTNHLSVAKIVTVLVNGEHQDEVDKIPEWIKSYASQQAGNASGDNSKQYNLFTGDAVSKFPGWTEDQNNNVLHHAVVCELKQVGPCPEGYKKVYVDNFRPRTVEELQTLLKSNDKTPRGSSVKETGATKQKNEDSSSAESNRTTTKQE